MNRKATYAKPCQVPVLKLIVKFRVLKDVFLLQSSTNLNPKGQKHQTSASGSIAMTSSNRKETVQASGQISNVRLATMHLQDGTHEVMFVAS